METIDLLEDPLPEDRRTKVMQQCAYFQNKTGFDDSQCAALLQTTRGTWNKWKNGKTVPVGNTVGLSLIGVSVLLQAVSESDLNAYTDTFFRAGSLDLEIDPLNTNRQEKND
jgi:hypothetical protein